MKRCEFHRKPAGIIQATWEIPVMTPGAQTCAVGVT